MNEGGAHTRASLSLLQGHSSIGRASVSKTEGRGFEALCPCHYLMIKRINGR